VDFSSVRGDIPRGTGGDKEKGDRKLPQPRRRTNKMFKKLHEQTK
jgi:hypothetical protein